MTTAAITLLHTNDLHNALEAWPRLATVIKQEMAAAAARGRAAAYVDAGDAVEMGEMVSYGTGGRVDMDLLAAAGCQVFLPGNNETSRLRASGMTALTAESSFPWVCANLRAADRSRLAGFHDWTMIELGGARVGFFGLTIGFPPAAAGPLGLSFLDAAEAGRRCVAELRAAGADVVVYLDHMGLRRVKELLLPNVPGVDLVIGGHTHELLEEPDWGAGVPVCMAGEFGGHVGVIDLDVDLAGHRVTAVRGRVVAVPEDGAVAPDPQAVAVIAAGRQAATANLSGVVAVLPVALPHDPIGESRLAPLYAEALRRHTGAEIGMAVGAVAQEGLAPGPVSMAQLFETCQALFGAISLELTGRQIAELLEQSEEPTYYGKLLWNLGMRPRGRPVGRLFTAGLPERLEPDQWYRVAAPHILQMPDAVYPGTRGFRDVRRHGPEPAREVFMAALPDLLDML